jgi:hypothetical protein
VETVRGPAVEILLEDQVAVADDQQAVEVRVGLALTDESGELEQTLSVQPLLGGLGARPVRRRQGSGFGCCRPSRQQPEDQQRQDRLRHAVTSWRRYRESRPPRFASARAGDRLQTRDRSFHDYSSGSGST